jgi:hypothetical protein
LKIVASNATITKGYDKKKRESSPKGRNIFLTIFFKEMKECK